ncbi:MULTISPECIES: discoidin domain-containing protein [unclassified Granulicatella]|uniref:endo-beta-N-acetylglucosaminidase n=1 Tax=unclassified Granulicatella TaxID=2630493 RepID=UPI0010740E7C|nr:MULTISPECIES: discoidin domain-containing protein [unclassified Granulicatella]MBF0780457.1 discoidin domain-containing protein [Granulicatella sp. 19428wC4_WM01]TFU95401.1 LPXTG cell wall anchor domain-containing protein [Granulicatella sp. WM01]
MKSKHKKYIAISVITLTGFLASPSTNPFHYVTFAQETSTETSSISHYERNPESTALFPNTLLTWSVSTDPNAVFNISKVPLASRVNGPNTNANQSQEAKVLSIAIVNKNTSGTPSQGGKNKEIYNFTNWQYVDTLVAWAGSAGEGIIVPPSGDITDVAHRNGVPVLGTVFFPPRAYGGKSDWVREFVQKDANGNYVMADKLLEMADAYGFDGWFINQETGTDAQTASELKQLLMYLQQHKKPHQQIVWYDSMLPSGDVYWQGELNTRNSMYFQDGEQRVSDKMFLDFRWTSSTLDNSKNIARALNRSPFELFAGLDVQANGINSSRKPHHILDNKGQLKTSIGLYVPDWTLRDGGKYNLDAYWENEKKFWINNAGDPRQVTQNNSDWGGISNYVVEKTPITTLPFVTQFNVGNGTQMFRQGKLVQTGDFNNRSVQDILPTYRWIIDNGNGNTLQASFSYQDAFNGGSSILLTGNMNKDISSFIKLYATSINPDSSSEAYLISKGDQKVELVLSVENADKPITLTSQQTTAVGENNWKKHQFSLKDLAGKKVTSIGINVYGENGNQSIYIGELGIGDFKTEQVVSPVTQVNVLGKTVHDDLTESVRLSWQSAGENTTGYSIYRQDENGQTFVGETSNTAFTLIEQKRGKQNPTYIIVPRDKNHVEHTDKSSSTTYQFEKMNTPEISIHANKTFVRAGEEIVLTAKASPSTEKISWRIPEADIISENDRTITVKFKKAGIFSAFATAENLAGQSTDKKEQYISVYDDSSQFSIENLALLPNVTANGSGFTNNSESYRFAFDDKLNTKWCDNRNEHPYMTVDLGSKKTITGFELHHAQAGGENSEWNTKDYDILVSDDGQNWTTVVEHRNNTKAVTQDSIPKIEGRYVKLFIQKAEFTGNTARIYEFKIFGINKTNVEVSKNATLISKLRDLHHEAKEVLPNDYTKESFEALEDAIKKSKTVLDNEATTEADAVQNSINQLSEALKQLTLKPSPVYETKGINVTLNEDKTMATFKDNDNDTSVFVKIPVSMLPDNIQSLVVKKRPTSTIHNKMNNLFDTYDIYFVDEQGIEQPLKKSQTSQDRSVTLENTNEKLEIFIPINKDKKVLNTHLLNLDGTEIVKNLEWTLNTDNHIIISTNDFRTIAIEFEEEKSTENPIVKPKDEDSNNPSSNPKSNTDTTTSTTSTSSTTNSDSHSTSSHQSSQSEQKNNKNTKPGKNKELPYTGSSNSLFTVFLGFIISLSGLFVALKRKK